MIMPAMPAFYQHAADARRPRRLHGRQDSVARSASSTISIRRGPVRSRAATADRRLEVARIASPAMFDAIAGRYDFLNHVLSAGLDTRWRRRAIASLRADRQRAGARSVHRHRRSGASPRSARGRGAARVVGVDFAGAMLRVGRREAVRARGSSAAIDAGARRRDADSRRRRDRSTRPRSRSASATSPTGAVACAEMHRVLKPGGRLAILEFAVPRTPGLRAAYLWYFRHVLPRIGRADLASQRGLRYLPASVGAFAAPEEFVKFFDRPGSWTSSRPADLRHRLSVYGASGLAAGSWLVLRPRYDFLLGSEPRAPSPG